MKKQGAKQDSYGNNAGVILRKNDPKVLTTGSESNEVTYNDFFIWRGGTCGVCCVGVECEQLSPGPRAGWGGEDG